MFSQEDFAEWSKSQIAYLHVSTRIAGKKHDGLFKQKGFRGFPSFCVMDADGEVIAAHAGNRDVAGFRATVAKGKSYVELREQARSGDAVAAMQLFVKNLELGRMNYAVGSLKFAAKAADMPDRFKREAKMHLASLLYKEVTASLRSKLTAGMDRAEYRKEYEQMMLDLFHSGNIPAGYPANGVLATVLRRAQGDHNVQLFERALAIFKQRFAGDQYYDRRIAPYEKQLQEMKQK